MVECRRVGVGGEEGNRVTAQRSSGGHGSSEMRTIQALYRGSRGYRKFRTQVPHATDSSRESLECAGHAANTVVNFGRAVQRDDDLVHVADDVACKAIQEKSRGQQGQADSALFQWGAKLEQIGMHQRFPAGEDNPFDAEAVDGLQLAREVAGIEMTGNGSLPDVAHNAAAIAAAEDIEDQDRE